MSKSLRWVLEPATVRPSRQAAVWVARQLRSASLALARIARRLGQAAPAEPVESSFFEFHADAGAPEGALFVNGLRVGTIVGVQRL